MAEESEICKKKKASRIFCYDVIFKFSNYYTHIFLRSYRTKHQHLFMYKNNSLTIMFTVKVRVFV